MSTHNRSIKIFIDNSDAMSNAKKLRSEISRLEGDLKSLESQGKKDSAGYKKSERDLNQLTNSYSKHQNKIQETERVLKNLSGATLPDLYRTRAMVRGELSKTTRGTEKHNRMLRVHNQVQKEITVAQRELNSQYGRQGTLMSKMAGGFNKYFGMATAFVASITGASFAFRRLSQDAAKMEDTYADVMKTTDLTREEVEELNKEFKKMDTRTAREQLNLLARDAGKLGMASKKDILDFVEAANIIQIALGEDLGDDAIKSIGKMSDVFKRATVELDGLDLKERMLSIGSAVNEVAQSSSASEPYLVAFAGRLGGVASQAGIGIDKILGFASALDQDMQAVEMSATALQRFIITLMSKPAEFAEMAKMEVSEFTNLLKTDANAAIKLVLRSLNEKGGFQELIPIFQQVGLDGARAVGVLSSMASSIDKIDEAQSLANSSMVEATSVVDEYNIKNENAQAQLEKRRKAFNDAAEDLGRRLNPALLKSTNYLTYLIKVLPDVLDFFAKWGPLLIKTAAIVVTYNLALKANSMWKRIMIADTIKLRLLLLKEQAATTLVALKYVFASRSARQLTMSVRALFATLSINPFALVVTAVAALTYGLYKLTNQSDKLLTKQTALIDVAEKANKSIASERAELDLLFAKARNELVAKKDRIEAIEKLNEISPDYLGNLNLENINTEAATNSIKKYTEELLKNAKAKAIADKISEKYSERLEKETEIAKRRDTIERIRQNVIDGPDEKIQRYKIRRAEDRIEKIDEEIDMYTSLNDKLIQNKHTREINSAVAQQSFEREQRALTRMQQEQSLLFEKQKEASQWGNQAFVDEQKIKMLSVQIEAQKKLVAEKKKELEVSNQIVEDDSVVEDSGSGVTGGKEADIYKEKLAALDAYLAEEKNKILQQRMEGKLSQVQYLRELEALEMEGLIRKMNIFELDSDQQIAVQNTIYEKKIAIMQKLEDDERAHQKRLLDLQKQADQERAKQNWTNLKAIAEQNKQAAKEAFDAQNKQKAELAEIGMEFSNEMGMMVGGFISGNEDLVASSLKNVINMGLDLLKVQVQMAIAGATAQSLAQPDSVATFGAAGFARAAILVGLIEGAFAAVKGVISSTLSGLGGKPSATISDDALTGQRVVTQRRDGKYDVIGADDGRMYSGVPYIGDARTGVVSTPTLMGEYGGELVVNAPDFRALQRHVNYPVVLQAIQQSRQPNTVPQRADGNYSQLPPAPSAPQVDIELMSELKALLIDLRRNPIDAKVNYFEFENAKNKIDTTKYKASRK